MKFSKRYVAFTILLALVFAIRFQFSEIDHAQIEQFRGGSLEASVWNPLIADDVNGSLLRVVIDNKEYTNENQPFYMNENRNIMIPVDILRDALNCSAHVYDGTDLLVEKHTNSVRFSLHEDSAVVGDKKVSIESALTEKDGTMFVSLNDLSELLGYSLNFDIVGKTVTTADTSESATIIPPRYDLREKQRVSKIRNQGSYGTCWAFAATSALESMMLPENPEYFAVDHMTLCNSFKVDQFDGGEYTMGMAYLAAWQGPVYEADDPDGDGKSDSSLTAVKHVQEMRIIDGKDYEAIKTAVFKYGGVQTTLYSNIRSSNPDSEYYNSKTSAYCYIGTEKPNHGVVIIGWDDNYSKDNFNTDLEGDGAFICQNSWGEKFGEDGVFYVSYYDTNIGTHNVVYTRVEDTDNYDAIYQSDLCGWVGSIGYEKESIFGANVYTANGDEEIAAAGFYATGAKTEYEVFVVNNFEDENSLVHRTSVASGTLDQAGYYTIDFDTPVAVENGERFAIVVYLNTPGALHPFALEYDDGEDALSMVDTSDGESYISASGMRFVNVKELQDCNLCIKAYSNKR